MSNSIVKKRLSHKIYAPGNYEKEELFVMYFDFEYNRMNIMSRTDEVIAVMSKADVEDFCRMAKAYYNFQ